MNTNRKHTSDIEWLEAVRRSNREAQRRWRETHPEEAKAADSRKRDRKEYFQEYRRKRLEENTEEKQETTKAIDPDYAKEMRKRRAKQCSKEDNRERQHRYYVEHIEEITAKRHRLIEARKAALAKPEAERTPEEQMLVEQHFLRRSKYQSKQHETVREIAERIENQFPGMGQRKIPVYMKKSESGDDVTT